MFLANVPYDNLYVYDYHVQHSELNLEIYFEVSTIII